MNKEWYKKTVWYKSLTENEKKVYNKKSEIRVNENDEYIEMIVKWYSPSGKLVRIETAKEIK